MTYDMFSAHELPPISEIAGNAAPDCRLSPFWGRRLTDTDLARHMSASGIDTLLNMPVLASSANVNTASGTPITHFECSKCGERLPADVPQTLCPKDAGSLWVRYDLKSIARRVNRDDIAPRPRSMWRYRELLPDVEPVTLGEGFTPMLASRKRANVWIKDEGTNPTGSFKARDRKSTRLNSSHMSISYAVFC